MRTAVCLVLAAGLLTGCAEQVRQATEESPVHRAIAAYRAGDKAAFDAVDDEVDAAWNALRSTPDWRTGCTPEAIKARVAKMEQAAVAVFDQSAMMHTSEENRFALLHAVAEFGGAPAFDRVDCGKGVIGGELKAMIGHTPAMLAFVKHDQEWGAELRAKHGAAFQARMAEAETFLEKNRIRTRIDLKL